jgi:hypothetical protein
MSQRVSGKTAANIQSRGRGVSAKVKVLAFHSLRGPVQRLTRAIPIERSHLRLAIWTQLIACANCTTDTCPMDISMGYQECMLAFCSLSPGFCNQALNW